MALYTHFNQPKIGCPGMAEFTVQHAESLAVFLCPTGIFVLTRCGLAADLSFFIDFYGLTLFAACGLNNGGVNDGGGCFLYF